MLFIYAENTNQYLHASRSCAAPESSQAGYGQDQSRNVLEDMMKVYFLYAGMIVHAGPSSPPNLAVTF